MIYTIYTEQCAGIPQFMGCLDHVPHPHTTSLWIFYFLRSKSSISFSFEKKPLDNYIFGLCLFYSMSWWYLLPNMVPALRSFQRVPNMSSVSQKCFGEGSFLNKVLQNTWGMHKIHTRWLIEASSILHRSILSKRTPWILIRRMKNYIEFALQKLIKTFDSML